MKRRITHYAAAIIMTGTGTETVICMPHRMGHETNVVVVYVQSENSKLSLSVCWLDAHNHNIRLLSYPVGLVI